MADSTAGLVTRIVIPTFVGSLLSFVASATALVLHITLPPKRHFRHALILNLLIADCINSFNNTVSGAVVLSAGHTLTAKAEATPACIVNAWVGQLSVQAVDFNILIISIVVLLTVFRTHLLSHASQRNTVLLCVAAWIPGLITSNVAWALGAYGHVSGNWCWIRRDQLGLRYGLTHGWRIAIFLATIAIYTVIYVRLTRVFGILRIGNTWSTFPSKHSRNLDGDDASAVVVPPPPPPQLPPLHPATSHDPEGIIVVSQTYTVSREPQTHHDHPAAASPTHELHSLPGSGPGSASASVRAGHEPDHDHDHDHDQDQDHDLKISHAVSSCHYPDHRDHNPDLVCSPTRDSVASVAKVPAPPNVRRMLLMNGYPIAYILLWIPGIANRLIESINGSSPRWLTALQASTQFVGFVNAVTYGYSEQMRRDLFLMWMGKRDFLPMRN